MHNRHTKMLLLGLRLFNQAEEELREVADDDEGWGQCWTAVVFHNQVVSLELPEDVCVALHYLECVAESAEKEEQKGNKIILFWILYCTKKPLAQLISSDRQTYERFFGSPAPDLNMAMSRLSSRTLVTRRKITSSRMTSQLA